MCTLQLNTNISERQAQNMTTEGPERLQFTVEKFIESVQWVKQALFWVFVLLAGSENSNAAGWAEQWGSAQQPSGGRWGGEGHLHFWRGLQTHQGGHWSDSYTGRAVERGCCTCCVYVWAKVLRQFIYLFFMCSFVGDSTTLHLTEGDTPTSGEAERREREVAAGAERAEGAPEQRVPGHEVLWRS